jgi:hypothetical protein
MHIPSQHIEPRPLCLTFLLRHGRILRGARAGCVARKQQRTAHPTRNRGGREIHRVRTGWYSFHLAPWISISCPQLYDGDDHIYRHVHLHGGHCNRQHGVPAARK